jgi:hypothetical protein
MATCTLPISAIASARDNQIVSDWTENLTKHDAEILLDRLEALGYSCVEVRCTHQGLFVVRLPWGTAALFQ